MNSPLILAIETSCDETSAALVRGRKVLSNIIYTQIPLHTIYGGVVPEIASRNHLEKIDTVIETALKEGGVSLSDVDAVAVTKGPGLIGALLVGVAHAKGLAYALGKPLIGVHHIEGHISAAFIENDIAPPFTALVVSGGHTSLVDVRDYGDYHLLARTTDDAAGEAFDKTARAIGLGYPGGPKIEKAAGEGNPNAFTLPRPKVAGSPDFSFSGLKTAVLNLVNGIKMRGEEIPVNDVAAVFQKTVIDTLTEHVFSAMEGAGRDTFVLCGGVAANLAIKEAFRSECLSRGLKFYTPSPVYCTDNAAMVGVAAGPMYLKGEFAGLDLNATASMELPGEGHGL